MKLVFENVTIKPCYGWSKICGLSSEGIRYCTSRVVRPWGYSLQSTHGYLSTWGYIGILKLSRTGDLYQKLFLG